MKILRLFVLLAIVHETPALAQSMSHHAFLCRPVTTKNGSSNWNINYANEYYTSYRIVGDTTTGNGTSPTLFCPLTVTDSISYVVARVWDRHTVANVRCTLYVFDETGSVQYSDWRETSGYDTSTSMSLSWSVTGLTTARHASLECTVPQKESGSFQDSGLAMVRVYQ